MMDEPRKYAVLIVDDSADDRFVLRKSLERLATFDVIGELTDGAEAIAYFSGEAPFEDREQHPLPDLVLLDLKMPRKNGFDVLKWLQEGSFPGMTVVVLSGSFLAEDIQSTRELGAHGYWSKAADMKQQNVIAQEIKTLMDKLSD